MVHFKTKLQEKDILGGTGYFGWYALKQSYRKRTKTVSECEETPEANKTESKFVRMCILAR